MRYKCIIPLFAVMLVLLAGCEQEFERMPDFKVDFATVLIETGLTSTSLSDHTPSLLRFQFDNGQIFTPINPEAYSGGTTGQRVIINYTPLDNNKLRIRGIANIHTGNIRTEGFPEQLRQDPVRIQSVWVGGDHLNLILEIQYHSQPHSISLLRDTESETIDLHLSYSRNDDPAGTTRLLHASFLLSSLRDEADVPVPFRFLINTHTGKREFQFELR